MRSDREDSTIAEAVNHPIRVAILEVLNQQDLSVTDFVRAGHADFYYGYRPDVSHIAYHFRELAAYGCLEPVAAQLSRGSLKTIYRGVARDEFVGEEWTKLPDEEKRRLSRAVARGLVARIDGAMRSETFNARDDRQLSWFAMRLDDRGWQEAGALLAEAFTGISRIQHEAEDRLRQSSETGLSATASILLFESPELATPD